jgi:hypothetical protein
MLNELLHGFVKLGLFDGVTSEKKAEVAKLLRKLYWKHDCNWGEIIDEKLAVLLETCAYCGEGGVEINPETGYCPKCVEELR